MPSLEDERSLALRAAWLHYVGGLRQAQVAKHIGVPSVKAHRLIMRAVAEGAVKVSIEGDIGECTALGLELSQRMGLTFCDVAPDLDEAGIPFRSLGLAGAMRLKRWIDSGEDPVIGIGHGRTLAHAVRAMPRTVTEGQSFVSLLGGLTRNYAANPHDVMHILAEKTGARAFAMPVPFFANTQHDRQVLLAQRGVWDVFEMANSAALKIAGVGTVRADTQLVRSGMIERDEIDAIKAAGGVGEMLGHFFDSEGRVIETPLTSRTLGVSLSKTRGDTLAVLAGGPEKVTPLKAVLNSGFLSGLITDERTATALLA